MFFGLLYDQRYQGVASLSQWLAVSVWTWTLRATMDRIPLAMGRTRELFVSNLLNCSGIGFGVLGYSVALLPGFVLGNALGNLVSHLFLTLRLSHEHGKMLAQSALFTVGWGGYACVAVSGLRYLGPQHLPVLTLGLAAIPCAVAGFAVRRQLFLKAV